MITVPAELAAVLLRENESGREWVDSFPERAERCLRRWGCSQDGEVTNGAVAVVIPVTSPDGPAVIKISAPHPGNTDEFKALSLWHGNGAVELFDHDADDLALLLERVDDRHLDVATDEGIVIGGELSARLAVVAPPEMKRLADTVDEWELQVLDHDRQSSHPLPDRVLGAAIETIRDLGQDRTPTMLHGDLHGKNILHADRGWVVIDPKGMAGTAAYDALTMSTYGLAGDRVLPVAEATHRITLFSEAAGVDSKLARCCVQARAVTALLWDLSHGSEPMSRNVELRRVLADGLLR